MHIVATLAVGSPESLKLKLRNYFTAVIHAVDRVMVEGGGEV